MRHAPSWLFILCSQAVVICGIGGCIKPADQQKPSPDSHRVDQSTESVNCKIPTYLLLGPAKYQSEEIANRYKASVSNDVKDCKQAILMDPLADSGALYLARLNCPPLDAVGLALGKKKTNQKNKKVKTTGGIFKTTVKKTDTFPVKGEPGLPRSDQFTPSKAGNDGAVIYGDPTVPYLGAKKSTVQVGANRVSLDSKSTLELGEQTKATLRDLAMVVATEAKLNELVGPEQVANQLFLNEKRLIAQGFFDHIKFDDATDGLKASFALLLLVKDYMANSRGTLGTFRTFPQIVREFLKNPSQNALIDVLSEQFGLDVENTELNLSEDDFYYMTSYLSSQVTTSYNKAVSLMAKVDLTAISSASATFKAGGQPDAIVPLTQIGANQYQKLMQEVQNATALILNKKKNKSSSDANLRLAQASADTELPDFPLVDTPKVSFTSEDAFDIYIMNDQDDPAAIPGVVTLQKGTYHLIDVNAQDFDTCAR